MYGYDDSVWCEEVVGASIYIYFFTSSPFNTSLPLPPPGDAKKCNNYRHLLSIWCTLTATPWLLGCSLSQCALANRCCVPLVATSFRNGVPCFPPPPSPSPSRVCAAAHLSIFILLLPRFCCHFVHSVPCQFVRLTRAPRRQKGMACMCVVFLCVSVCVRVYRGGGCPDRYGREKRRSSERINLSLLQSLAVRHFVRFPFFLCVDLLFSRCGFFLCVMCVHSSFIKSVPQNKTTQWCVCVCVCLCGGPYRRSFVSFSSRAGIDESCDFSLLRARSLVEKKNRFRSTPRGTPRQMH